MNNAVLNMPQGETPLARVFWLYGVIPSNLLWAVTLVSLSAGAPALMVSTLLLVLLVYTAWIVTAVWRNADNVADARYGVMARWLTVAWAINTVMMVGFLLVDQMAI